MQPRPTLASSLAKALSIGAKKRGLWAYVPAKTLVFSAIGGVVSYFVPAKFWGADIGTTATVYGGVLAFNAILLAVGWGAFSKIYEVIGGAEFGAFLRRHDVLDLHIMFVDLVHITLAFAAAISFASVVGLILPIPLIASRILLAIMIAGSGLAMVEAMRATTMMNDLIWEKAHADLSVPSNVSPLGKSA